MIKKIIKFIQDKELLQEKDRVIVGVSGGADSVCLLLVLLELCHLLSLEIIPVHINHNLRGDESQRDEDFVRELCREKGLNLQVVSEDVKSYQEKYKVSEEEAGRNIRRSVFEEVSDRFQGHTIALGHHKDDNVETALMHMARGSGLTGLCGMDANASGYIRPLLCVGRKEIEVYLQEKEQEYCIDSTNLGNDYTRNKVRNIIIPLINSEVNAKASENIGNVLGDLNELKLFVASQVELIYDNVVNIQGNAYLVRKEDLEQQPIYLQGEVIKSVLYAASEKQKDISRIHVQSFKELLTLQVGREIHLPHDLLAKRVYEGVEIRKKRDWSNSQDIGSVEVPINGQTVVNESLVIKTEVMEYNGIENVEDNHYTKHFDYDIIMGKLFVERIDMKSSITINGQGGRQSLKKFCTNQKIASHLRKEVLNIRTESQVLWILNYRKSQEALITKKTKKILKIQIGG